VWCSEVAYSWDEMDISWEAPKSLLSSLLPSLQVALVILEGMINI
jgi:hypothetical protein